MMRLQAYKPLRNHLRTLKSDESYSECNYASQSIIKLSSLQLGVLDSLHNKDPELQYTQSSEHYQ